MTAQSNVHDLKNPMHVRLAAAFRISVLTDFEARVLDKGYVSREDYEEAYRLWVHRMTLEGFAVEDVKDSNGYYIPNWSSEARDELHRRSAPPEEVSRFEEKERATVHRLQKGTFLLVNAIFHEQAHPSGIMNN
ncbi:hypothetical protein DQ354_19725 [Arthrobacter sp. AQ5-06]|nr:hypothetical protein DQ354_19725 [Arthrobacter sp. AQ5-06]